MLAAPFFLAPLMSAMRESDALATPERGAGTSSDAFISSMTIAMISFFAFLTAFVGNDVAPSLFRFVPP
jgi:hypothetical protein